MKKEEENIIKQYLADYLEQKQLRPTITRTRILENILSRCSPFSADGLYEDMKDKFYVSRATVYNTLQLFLECNLIVKYYMSCNSASCYELSRNLDTSTHHVLVCTECGKTRNLVDRQLSNLIQTRGYKGYKVKYHLLTIYGLCSECGKKLAKKQKGNNTINKHK